MEQKNKLIPELRFPEFLSDLNWSERLIEEFFSVGSSKRILQEDWTNKGIPFYRTRELVSLSKNEPFGSEIFISEKLFSELSEKYEIPSEGDYLVSGVGTLGICYQVKANDKFYFKDGNVLWFKLRKGIVSNYFKFCFQSEYIQNQILKQASVSTVGTYTIQNAKKTSLLYPPSLNEQQKIADCLTSLDDVISAHTDKLEALKNHKKGLLQNLFPQEGKKVPNYRFPEFVNDGEWEPTTVDENCNVKGRIGFRGYTKEDLVSKEKGVLVIGGKHIQNHMLDLSDPTFLSLEKYYESPEIMIEINDIVFSQRGTLGDCAIIDREIGDATINPSMVLLKKIKCNPRFLYYILIGESIQNEVAKSRTSAAIPMLSQKQIREFSFLIPNPKEQKKIAECLSVLDNLISERTLKIEQLKAHKKGLIQGLFPKIN
ncbi:restriction endonuclease subunit S [uncultured Chryseobacterium sp.]|uniref:restriction endonuclease subunit S n=1 Tax=uncultured Chryseobacterium sp. TaxID=259322 RepID=UPI0025F68A10|nr:restriction endonuclease subunit S [uncultured Chryseobacterium sp.]